MSLRIMRAVNLLIAGMALSLLAACGGGNTVQEPGPSSEGSMQWHNPPAMKIDIDKHYEALVKTSKGDFTIELFAKDAPETVNNFIFLAKEGFYDGVTFHRIIASYMIQTGDPTGTGAGGPGYTIKDELNSLHKYDVGIVAMANRYPKPNTGGSQFFICTGKDCEMLNDYPYYPIFGKVTAGLDTLYEIDAAPVKVNPRVNDDVPSLPVEPITIESIEISEKK